MPGVIDPTEYVIRTRFETQREIPGLTAATRSLTAIEGKISGLGRNLTGAFAGLATGAGVAAAVKGVVTLNSESQNARYGIASLTSALTGSNWTKSLDFASAMMQKLRADAAAGAGETQDYVEAFQQMMAPGLQAGADPMGIEKMTRLALAGGFALRGNEGLKLAPMDVLQAMTAGAGDRTTPIVNQALRSIGMTNEAFNKLSAPDRWKTLEKAFGSFEESANAMGQTWGAQTATFTDAVKDLVMTGTAGLFDRWTEDLKKVNAWLAANREVMRDMADNVGSRLVSVWEAAKANPTELAGGGAGLVGASLGSKAIGAAGIAGGAGAALAAGAAVFFGFVTYSATQGLAAYEEARVLMGWGTGRLWEALTGLGGTFLRLMKSPWVAWIGGGFAGLVGGFLGVTGVFLKGFGMWVTAFATLSEGAWEIFHSSMSAGDRLRKGDFTGAAFEFEKGLGRSQNAVKDLKLPFTAEFDKELMDFAFPKPVAERLKKAAGGTDPFFEEGWDDAITAKGPPVFNGDIKIEIKTERLDDPAMVATSFEAVMEHLRNNPRSSTAAALRPKPR